MNKVIKNHQSMPKALCVGFFIFSGTLLFTAFIASSLTPVLNTNADDVSTNINVSLAENLSITATPSILEFNLTPTPDGVFSTKNININVSTNNATGYTLTMEAIGEDTSSTPTTPVYTNNLIHTNPTISSSTTLTTKSIDSIPSDITLPIDTTNLNTPLDDAIDSSSFPLNKWAYTTDIPSTNPTPTSATFHKLPISGSEDTINSTTIPTNTSSTNVTIATKVDTNIPSGTYTNTIKFTATPNYIPPQITFFPETLTTMQGMTTEICSSVTTPANTATTVATTKAEYTDPNTQAPQVILTDTRDNNTYTVTKLADGNCWMTQNLRLGSTSAAVTLTSANSDVSSNFTIPTSAIQTSGATSWGPHNNETAVNTVHVYNNGNSWIQPTSSGKTSTVNTTGTPPNQSQYMGNYYNWYTATAGTGTYAMTSGNASSSICPKGWKLPTGSANSDFTGLTGALVNITTNTSSVPAQSFTMQSAPNWFSLAGFYDYNGGVLTQGSNGYWWSSTANNRYGAYYLNLNTTNVNPQNNDIKATGFSVRCVAK